MCKVTGAVVGAREEGGSGEGLPLPLFHSHSSSINQLSQPTKQLMTSLATRQLAPTGMWGACYECCLPNGGGIKPHYVAQLADIGNRAMDMMDLG